MARASHPDYRRWPDGNHLAGGSLVQALLKRVRIDVGFIVLGIGLLVEEIPPFLQMFCLQRGLLGIPLAQRHVEFPTIERIVPGVAWRWFERAISVGVGCPPRLTERRIARPFLPWRNLVAVNRISAVADPKLAYGSERSFVTDLESFTVIACSRHRVVEHDRDAATDEDEALRPADLR